MSHHSDPRTAPQFPASDRRDPNRNLLPGEDPSSGLYIRRRRTDRHVLGGVRIQVQEDDHKRTLWVHGSDFMAMQRERDQLSNLLAVINAEPDLPDVVVEFLRNAGYTEHDGDAIRARVQQTLSRL